MIRQSIRIAGISAICALLGAACASRHTFFLKNEDSGRLYGPLSTAGMADRFIPEGVYRLHYPKSFSPQTSHQEGICTNIELIVDLYDDGTPVPKTQWTEQEQEFFASPKFRCILYENELITSTPTCIRENLQIYISSNKTHASWWRVHEFTGGTATVWRLPPNHLPLPNILSDADINTHLVLTGIRIREVSYLEATIDEIVEDIRNRIHNGDPKGNIRVLVEPPPDGVWPEREQKNNFCLRDLSVMDLLDILAKGFCLVSIRFDGKDIIITRPKGSDSTGAPPTGSSSGQL